MNYTNVKIDFNLYLKLFSSLYSDNHMKVDKKNFLNQLFTMFSHDHPEEVYSFGSELLEEYIDLNHQFFPSSSSRLGDSDG
jgi:hypothetical protein